MFVLCLIYYIRDHLILSSFVQFVSIFYYIINSWIKLWSMLVEYLSNSPSCARSLARLHLTWVEVSENRKIHMKFIFTYFAMGTKRFIQTTMSLLAFEIIEEETTCVCACAFGTSGIYPAKLPHFGNTNAVNRQRHANTIAVRAVAVNIAQLPIQVDDYILMRVRDKADMWVYIVVYQTDL